MKKMFPALLAVILLSFRLSEAEESKEAKLWHNLCESCHNGQTAPDARWMKGKYRAAEEFVSAVRGKGDRCMNLLKNDPSLARAIAEEIGIGK